MRAHTVETIAITVLMLVALLPSFAAASPNASQPSTSSTTEFMLWLNNTGTVGTGPFQYNITVNLCEYPGFATNLSNLAVFNGTVPVPAWVQQTCASRFAWPIVWVNLTDIPAGGQRALSFVAETGFQYSATGATGEAPQLSPSWGQWDNGPKVFPFYDNFAGTTLNSRWVTYHATGLSVSNTLNFDITGGAGVGNIQANLPASMQSTSVEVMFNMSQYGGTVNDASVGLSTATASSSTFTGYYSNYAIPSTPNPVIAGEGTFGGTYTNVGNTTYKVPPEAITKNTVFDEFVSVVPDNVGNTIALVNVSVLRGVYDFSAQGLDSHQQGTYRSVALNGNSGGTDTNYYVYWSFAIDLPVFGSVLTTGYSPKITTMAFNQPFGFENVVLPAWPASRVYFSGTTITTYDSVVISRFLPGNLPPSLYYINASNDLVSYNPATHTVTLLHAWTILGIGSFNGEVTGFQAANGTLEALYMVGFTSTSGDLTAEIYWLANSTYVERTFASIAYQTYTYGLSMGLFDQPGWVFFQIDMTSTYAVDVYSGQTTHMSNGALVNWASSVLFSTVNQAVMEINSGSNPGHIVDEAWNLTLPNGVPTLNFHAFNSSTYSFITGLDLNAQPLYFRVLSNGTTLYQNIGASSSGGGQTYHNTLAYLSSDMLKDNVDTVINVGYNGTSAQSITAVRDDNGYFFNGFDLGAAVGGAGPQPASFYTSPFQSSETGTVKNVFASNSPWFNGYLATHPFGYVSSQTFNNWQYFSNTGTDNAIDQNATVTLYWLNAYITSFEAGKIPSAPTNVTATLITSTSALISWTQATGGGVLNNTLYWNTSALPVNNVSIPTATNYSLTGLSADTLYGVQVSATNMSGQGPASSIIYFRTVGSIFIPGTADNGGVLFIIALTFGLTFLGLLLMAVRRMYRESKGDDGGFWSGRGGNDGGGWGF